MNQITLSVIIPAFNEAKRITNTLDEVLAFFQAKPFTYELLIVDDGSQDTTVDIIKNYLSRYNHIRLLRHRVNRGKGQAVKNGMLAARGQWSLFMDADLATPILEFDKIWKYRTQADVIIGSRYMLPDSIKTPQSWSRQLVSRLGNQFIQMALLPSIVDTQCGFKLFSRPATLDIFPRQESAGWSFDIEILALARSLSYPILEVPVDWHDQPNSRVKLISDSYQVFSDVLKIRRRIQQTDFSKIVTQKVEA